MSDENNNLVNLGDLGSASPDDLREALRGQPDTVKGEPKEDVPAEDNSQRYLDLGAFNDNLVMDGDEMKFINPYSPDFNFDLDQFETKRRRVSEGSMLSGILNGVEGLEENFQYTGIDSVVNRSQEAQGVVNKMKNGFTQLITDTSLNVAQGFTSLLYGVPSAIVNGDLTKLYDNAVANSLDKGTEFLDEFYKIKRGGNQSTGQKAANFIFDDIFGAASFVMGAIATELAFTAISTATFGAAAPAQVAVTGGLVARGTRLANKALNGGKWLMSGGMIDDALKGASQLSQMATRQAAGQALRNAGKAIATPQALHTSMRVGRQLITGASMEAGMEARHMLNTAVEDHKHQYEELYGQGSFTEQMGEDFRQEISGYGDQVFGLNMALVGGSNMLMFPKLFGVGLGKGMRNTKLLDTSTLSAKAQKRLAKNLGVEVGNLPKFVDAAQGNTFGRIVGRGGELGRITAANTKNALYEGFVEEGGQGAISRTAEDYISKKYDPRGLQKTANFAESFLEGLAGSYGTGEGFKEIGLGMLLAFTGVPMYVRSKNAEGKASWNLQMMGGFADQRAQLLARDKQVQSIINLSERNGDVNGILKAEIENMNRQNVLSREQEIAAGQGDFKRAKDIESDMIFSHAASKILTGRYEQSLGEARQILDEMSEDEFREQLGPEGKNMTDEEVRQHKTKAYDTYKGRMERARLAYEQAREVYRGTDPDVYTGVANMLYNAEELDAREKRVAEKMAEQIEGFTPGQVLDVMRAQAELGLSDKEVALLAEKSQRLQELNNVDLPRIEQNIITAEAAAEAKAERAREQAQIEEEIAQIKKAKETQNNVDRNKYTFDPVFLEDLRQLHDVKSAQQGSTYRGEDIQRMYDDLVNIAADRMKVIEAYNDFIKPGGVQRFEDRMRGSIERLAQLSPEEKLAQMQAEADEADRKAFEEETNTAEKPAGEQQSTIVEEEDDDFEDPGIDAQDDYGVVSEESLQDGSNMGFPEMETDDYQAINDPAEENADNTTAVKPAVQEEAPNSTEQPPVAPPPGPPATPPTRVVGNTARGSAPLNLVNPRNGTPNMVAKGKEGIAAAIFENNIKEGTELRVRLLNGSTANGSSYQIETMDGDVIAQYSGRKKGEVLPQGMYEALLLNNGAVTITVSEIQYKNTRGGERVRYTTREGQQKEELTREQRMLKNVLPDMQNDIVGYAIMGDEALLKIGGLEVPRGNYRLSPDARFSGNTYVFTKDARDGGVAYHNVQMETFGAKRAKQIMYLIDAWHDYVYSGGVVSPGSEAMWKEFIDKAEINLEDGWEVNTKKMASRLQAMIPSNGKDKQKKVLDQAAANGVEMQPLISILPNAAKGTIEIWVQDQKMAPIQSHKDSNPNSQDYVQVQNILANTRINVDKGGDVTVLPNGDGTFDVYEPDALIQEFGAFGNRMPTVINGKVYNANPTDLVYTFEAPVEVPRGEPTVENERSNEPVKGADPIDYDVSQIDLGDISFLPNEVDETAKDPMDRAGSYYEIPGLTAREVRDGVNFSAGIMSRAMMQHMRTKDRKKNVTVRYLRERLKRTLEAQRNAFRMQPQSATRDAIIAAHDSWLDETVFNRLVDMSLIEMMRQTKDIVELRRGNLQNIFDRLTDPQYDAAQADDADAAERVENPLAAFDDNAAFGVDPKSTLRLEAKLVLLSLKHNPKSGLITPETFGLAGPRFMNHADLMEKLNAATVGVTPSWNKVEETLQRKVTTYPEFQTVLDALSDEAALADLPQELRDNEKVRNNTRNLQDMIRNQFTTYASKVRTTRESLRIRRQVENEDRILREADIEIYNSNQRNMREHTRKDMRSVLVSNGFFTLSGEIVPAKFQGLVDQMDKIAEAPSANRVPALAMLLNMELGIDIPLAAISSTNQTVDRKGKPVFADIEEGLGNPVANQGAYGKLYRSLKAVAKREMGLEDFMSDRSKVGGADVIDFFVSLADYRENFIQNSSKDGDGKILWQYSAPKLLHQMFDDVVYGTRGDLLRGRVERMIDKSTVEQEDYRRDLQITYLSGIKQENEGMERDFHDMEDGDLALAKLALYGNRGKTSVRGTMQLSAFLMPTLADKHTMPIVKLPALRFGGDLKFVANAAVLEKQLKDITVSDVINDINIAYGKTVRPAVQKEIDRMKRLYRGDYEGMTEAQRNGYAFVMMPALNGLATELKNRKITPVEFEKRAHKEAAKVFERSVSQDMQSLLEGTSSVAYNAMADGTLGAIKLFNINRSKFQFLRDHLGIAKGETASAEMVKLAFLGFVAKYAMDSMAVRTGLVMDMLGDPAVFIKTDKAGNVKVAKTATNMGKRFASLIAPGNAIPYVEWAIDANTRANNHMVRTLVIPARTVDKASHYDYLKKLGQTPDQLAMQEGYDSADAAEYTTVQEHLSILYAQGKISRSEMMGLINKIEAGKDIDPSEVLAYFQPMKPVTTGRVGDHTLYVKSASFPLLPQFTRGTELDKLRVFMEDEKINRAAYDSAVKLGNKWAEVDSETATADQRMISVHEGNKVITPEGLEDRVIEYDRKFMRIQQEVPVSGYKEKVHGSQVAKLVLVNLNNADFALDGAPMKGSALYEEYINARKIELEARKELFAQKYGMQNVRGQYVHTDASRAKFAERMLEEAITRGYDVNELAYLHYNTELGEFTTPIVASPSQERLENLIKAIIFKEVYEPMIPGYSGPIRPEVGLGVVDNDLLNRNDVVWVVKNGKRLFNGKLQVAKDGNPDQILLPWKYKVKLKQFLTDGNLDLDKLGDKFPEELLRTFAYRIPGQRKSSSAAFEIVGFLPESMGDTLIVPEELVGRIGQDYDIDKMFGLLWSIEDKGGKIEIIRDVKTSRTAEKTSSVRDPKRVVAAARNRMLDIYYASMTSRDEAVQQAIHAPVTDGYGEQLADILDPVSENVGMPMSDAYNAGKAKAARSAKRTIGVMAVHNVFHSQLQQMLSLVKKGIPIQGGGYVEILDENGKRIPRSGLGSAEITDKSFVNKYFLNGKEYTPQAETKADQFSRLLNHAVDNENNGLLARLGINQDTWGIWTGLTHMGYNQETIALFVKLPVVQEYVERKQNFRRLGVFGWFDAANMVSELEKKLAADQFREIKTKDGKTLKELKSDIGVLSKKNIFDIINNESTLENNQAVFDVRVARALMNIEAFDKEARKLQRLLRLDTNRPKTLIEHEVNLLKMQEVLLRRPNANRIIDADYVLGDIMQKTVAGQVSQQAFETSHFFKLDKTDRLSGVLMQLTNAMTKAQLPGQTAEHVATVMKGAKSLAYANFLKQWTGRSASEIRDEAHDVGTGGIAQRLIEMRKTKPEIAQNAFVKQLVAVKSPGTYPHIEFTGDRGLELSAVEMHRSFLSMFKSKDPEVRAFAEELAVYGVATSLGRLKARGYMKYIPAEYLQSKGLAEHVNPTTVGESLGLASDIEYNSETAFMLDILQPIEGLRQVVRHNPEVAPRYVESTEIYRNNFKVIDGQLFMNANAPSMIGHVRIGNKLYTSVDLKQLDDGSTYYVLKLMTPLGDHLSEEYTTDHVPFVKASPQVYASQSGIDSFGFTAPNDNYELVDDGSGYSEAYYDDSAEMGDYNVPEPGVEGENVVHDVNNEVVRNNAQPVGPQTMLNHLERNVPKSKNAPFIMEMLRVDQELNPDNPIKIKLIEPNSDSYYNRKDNTVYVSPENAEDMRVLTHEITHGLTAMGLAIASGRIKAPKGVNAEKVKAAVAELDTLRRVAEQSLEKMGLKASELAQFRRGYNVFRRMQESRMDPDRKFAPIAYTDLSAAERADYDFMFRNRDKYYGFIDVNEFIAEAMTNKEFAERLAKIDAVPTETRKGFIARFLDKISQVLNALGIQISNAEQTLLADVYAQSMNLMDLTNKKASEVAERIQAQSEYDSDIESMSFLPNVAQAEGYQLDSRDMLVTYKKKRVRQFQELMSRYKNNKMFRKRVAPRLLQEEEELRMLTDDSVVIDESYLLAMGQRELDLAKRVIQSVDATDPEISVALSALQNVYSVIDFYGQYRSISKDPDLKDAATSLLRESAQLREEYLEKARVVLREAAKREFAGKGVNVDANTFEELVESGFVSSTFQDASRQGLTELSFLDKIVRDSAQKQRVEFNRRAKEYLDASAKMKKGAYFKKYSWNGFVELDAQGNPTSRIITMLNDQFDIARERKFKTSSKQEYLKWLKQTSLKLNIDSVFVDKDGVVSRKKNPAYERLLEEKLGKYGASEALRQQETRYQEFVDRREAAYDNIELTVPRAEQEEAKAVWMQENKWRKDLRFPLKEVNGKSSEFYDARFDELMADKDAKAFYEFYRQQIMELGRMLPAHKMRKQARLLENGLFIPAISKTLMEEVMETQGYGEKVGKLTDSFKASLTVDAEANLNNLIDPTTGRPRQELPTYFLGQLDPKTQEYDMDKTFLGFAMMATTYDSKNQVEDKVKMVRSVLSGATIIKDPNNKVNSALDPKLRDAKAREDVMRSVDTVVDTFYGVQQRRDITGNAPESMWTREQKAKIEDLREQLLTAQSKEAKERIRKEIEEATPKLSTVKAARQAQQLSQAMGMAWNLPAGIVNMVFGGLSVFKHAAGRADFNEKHARKATGIMLSSSLNMMTLNTGLTKNEVAEKIQNMMINMDVLKDFTEMRYDVRKFAAQAGESGVAQKGRGVKDKLRMYEIQRSSEYFVYGQGTIATLLSIEVDGKNLWEHMDADGVIQLDGYRPGEAKHLELMNKIDQINKRIHGNYDPNSPIAIKKTTLGPLLMQFRSWLPEAIATRFEKESYDPYLDRTVKGSFRTMWNKKHLRAMFPLLLPSFIRTKGMDTLPPEISELDQENIRKFSAGVRQWLQVMVFLSLLRAMKDDEDKEENIRFYNAALNLAGRVETDLGLFGDPRNIFEMTQGDMLAVIGLLGRVADFFDAMKDTAMGEGEITTGVYAGKNKMLHHGGKLIPHVNSVQRIVNQMEREMN